MQKRDLFYRRFDSIACGGLLAISIALLPSLLSPSSLDLLSFIIILAFSLALPLLAGFIYIRIAEDIFQRSIPSPLITITSAAGILLDIVGLSIVFWRVSWLLACLFLLSSVLALSVFRPYTKRLERLVLQEEGAVASVASAQQEVTTHQETM